VWKDGHSELEATEDGMTRNERSLKWKLAVSARSQDEDV